MKDLSPLKQRTSVEQVLNWVDPMKVVMDSTWPFSTAVSLRDDCTNWLTEFDAYCSTDQTSPQQVLSGEGAGFTETEKQEAVEYNHTNLVHAHLFANSPDMLKALDDLIEAETEQERAEAMARAKEVRARFDDLQPELVVIDDPVD